MSWMSQEEIFRRYIAISLNDSCNIIYYTGIWGIIIFVFTCCGFQNMMVLPTFSINNMTFSGIISLGSSDGQNFNHHLEISAQGCSVKWSITSLFLNVQTKLQKTDQSLGDLAQTGAQKRFSYSFKISCNKFLNRIEKDLTSCRSFFSLWEGTTIATIFIWY